MQHLWFSNKNWILGFASDFSMQLIDKIMNFQIALFYADLAFKKLHELQINKSWLFVKN